MHLNTLIDEKTSPGQIRRKLLARFDAVNVNELNREGWFEMTCWQGWGEDARLRLRIRFINLPVTGWNYVVKPGNHP